MNTSKLHLGETEIFIIPYKGKNIVYSPLYGIALLVNQKAVEELGSFVANQKENVTDFTNEFVKMLKGSKSVKLNDSYRYNDSVPIDFKPTLIGLALTTDCNLSCVYCHADAGINSEHLDYELAEIALKLVHDYAIEMNEPFDVSYAGFGEPTVSWDLFVKCTEYVKLLTRQSGVKCIISTATNGVFSKAKAKYISDNLSHISLSFDGPEDIQNRHRPFQNKKGSFNIVYDNAKLFWENGFSFAIRATVSDFSVNRMEEIYSFFQEEFPGIRVGFEALNPLGRGYDCSLKRPNDLDFTRNFIETYKLSSKIGGELINSGLGRLKEIKTVFCKSLSAPSVTLTPSGHLSSCQRDGAPSFFHYGYVDRANRAFVVDYKKIKQFRSMDVRAFPECQDCFCKYHCGGDCQDLRRVGVLRCNFIRELCSYNLYRLLIEN